MGLKIGYQALIAEALSKIETLNLEQANALLGDADTSFIDIRDIRELEREGMLPGALHAPRGMLEFWVDPESPYYKPVFGEGKRLVLYCGLALSFSDRNFRAHGGAAGLSYCRRVYCLEGGAITHCG